MERFTRKGAVLTHEGIVQNSYDGLSRIGVEAGDVVMHHMPLFHCMGCGAVAHGSTILLAPVFDADVVVRNFNAGLLAHTPPIALVP